MEYKLNLIYDDYDYGWVWIKEGGSSDDPMSPLFDTKEAAIDWLAYIGMWWFSKQLKVLDDV